MSDRFTLVAVLTISRRLSIDWLMRMQVVVDVAVILLGARADGRHARAEELAGGLEQRRDACCSAMSFCLSP